MIQLNLLPDVKIEYINTRRTKRSIILISSFLVVVSIGVTGLLLSFVYVGQKAHLDNLNKDINDGISEIQNTDSINEILTIQNQLGVVNTKHEDKPDTTRILSYIAQVLPEGAKITQISIDFSANTISMDGTTTDLNSTNKLVDTIKFAEYTLASDPKPATKPKPFSEVVLGSFSEKDGKSTYSVSMKFDPIIFKNTEVVTINIPGIVSTRSSTEKPIFEVKPTSDSETEGQGQ